MRILSLTEIDAVNGGSYEAWEVVTIAGASSGIVFGTIEAYQTWSLLTGLKFLATCSIPTAVVAGAIVGSVHLYHLVHE